jgi:hypothetical protein
VGEARFYGDLFMVGLLYHLYNQFAFNTLQRVSPVSHGVCNVVKRVVIIFSSVLFFNQVGWGCWGRRGGAGAAGAASRACAALRSAAQRSGGSGLGRQAWTPC